ncbi:MAG: succinate dehydrogenase/fumarate reductase iron-sulfur subunit [Desulfobacterales bacterium]|nr:succinate dehydrogenase/fumarate reductase iron-sulfur subunit [Desulfobacterales bacterium]
MSTIRLTLKVWRQPDPGARGSLATYETGPVSTDMSFLEMLDVVNEQLTLEGRDPIAFDHDCREGICGMCGTMVNGQAHGPEKGTTLCQLHLRHFQDNDILVIEPFRARAFKVEKDLIINRSSLDDIIVKGGYISVNTGGAPDGNVVPIARQVAEKALDASACIGCGACVAACPNASAMLFVGAKISHLALLPQGGPERAARALGLVNEMGELGFGNCSNERECEKACPKSISITNIARLNREYFRAVLCSDEE